MSDADHGRTAASVKQRLLNYSREHGEVFHHVLVRFGIERLLYRLAQSQHADQFVLKGATLFTAWTGTPHRPTQDLDLLGYGEPSAERLARVFGDICVVEVEPDGIVFEPGTIKVEPIRPEANYDGLRVRLRGFLGSAHITSQIDIGFGDAVTPRPRMLTIKPILDLPAPIVQTYPPETVVAEKFHAMLERGMVNSRMKDYFDLWTLGKMMAFEAELLRSAILATIARRGTPMPADMPIGLTDAFSADDSKQRQWEGFIKRIGAPSSAPSLQEVVRELRDFLGPVLIDALGVQGARWTAGGPWRYPNR